MSFFLNGKAVKRVEWRKSQSELASDRMVTLQWDKNMHFK